MSGKKEHVWYRAAHDRELCLLCGADRSAQDFGCQVEEYPWDAWIGVQLAGSAYVLKTCPHCAALVLQSRGEKHYRWHWENNARILDAESAMWRTY